MTGRADHGLNCAEGFGERAGRRERAGEVEGRGVRCVRRAVLGLWVFGLQVLGLGVAVLMAPLAHSAERTLTVELETDDRSADGRCEVELGLAPGHQGLVAARREGLFEVAALAFSPWELGRFEVGFDGVWLSFRGTGPCDEGVEQALSLWRRAASLKMPGRVVPPALTPPETAGLRRDAALMNAVAMALGASDTTEQDAALLELLVDALAVAPGRLVVRGRPAVSDLRALRSYPRSAAGNGTPSPSPRAALMPMAADGTTTVYTMWQLAADEARLGPVLAALLGHPGHRLHERLVTDMGLVHTLEARWLAGPRLLVLMGSLPGPGHGAMLERLFVELATLVRSLRAEPAEHLGALTGAAVLAGVEAPSAREISNALIGLERERAVLLVEPGREDLDTQVAHVDSALILRWVAATLDLRCPAPDETRDKNTLLLESHQLEPRRYLALTRALGRDTERMRQLDRELVDRCDEDRKLRRMLRPELILKLHREVRCGAVAGPDAVEEIARRKVLFKRYRIDSSAYRPLVAMLRRSPVHAVALLEIEARCEVAP